MKQPSKPSAKRLPIVNSSEQTALPPKSTTPTTTENDYSWLTPDFYANAYREFIQLRWHFDPFPESAEPIIDPGTFNDLSPSAENRESNAARAFIRQIRAHKLEDFLRSLCNELNSYTGWLIDLAAWQVALKPFDGSKRYHLLQQFVSPLCTLILSFPYAFKSQMEYASCKIAGMLSAEAAAKQPKANRDYRSKHFRIAMSYLEGSDALVSLVEKINSRSFEKGTKEFRHHSVHRVPIQIEYGLAFDVIVSRKGT